MTLEELRASAPRSFDKILLDLMVVIQSGGQPIVHEYVAPPQPEPMAPVVTRHDGIVELLQQAVLAQGDEINKLKAALGALAREAGGA